MCVCVCVCVVVHVVCVCVCVCVISSSLSPDPQATPPSPAHADATAELFSGSEEGGDPPDEIAESASASKEGSVEVEGGEEEKEDHTPRAFGDSQRKRPNPFKVSLLISLNFR